jgi:hypothetical protein
MTCGTEADTRCTHNSSRASETAEFKQEDLVVRTRPDTTIPGQCALELYSCFIEAIAARIENVGGRTVLVRELAESEVQSWRNSVFASIADECVSAGLAYDVDEAYTVIIPAFRKHNLLPRKVEEEEINHSRDENGVKFATVDRERYSNIYPGELPTIDITASSSEQDDAIELDSP